MSNHTDSPARFICKSCGAETPAGIGYVQSPAGPLPAPSCAGVHLEA